jgi:hypothetical protein
MEGSITARSTQTWPIKNKHAELFTTACKKEASVLMRVQNVLNYVGACTILRHPVLENATTVCQYVLFGLLLFFFINEINDEYNETRKAKRNSSHWRLRSILSSTCKTVQRQRPIYLPIILYSVLFIFFFFFRFFVFYSIL